MFVSVCYRLQHEPAASKWRGCRYRSQRHDRTGVRVRRHERDESPHRVASEYDVTRTSGRTLNNDVYTVWLQLEVGFVTLPSERSSTSRRTPSAAASCASTSTASKTATTSGPLSSNTMLSSRCFSLTFPVFSRRVMLNRQDNMMLANFVGLSGDPNPRNLDDWVGMLR